MELSCQPDLKVKRLYETSAWLRDLLGTCWVLERTPQATPTNSQRFAVNKQAWSLLSHTHLCTNTFHWQGLTAASLTELSWQGVPPFFVLAEAGEAHLPTQGSGDRAHCLLLLQGRLVHGTNPKRTSLPSCGRSSHIAGALSLCPPLKICNFLASLYISLQAVSRGKGNNPHCYTEGKAGLFWQREVTLTKYFTNHLLNNCYPRLKRRHITTLKIVCSTAQPWKALVSVRAVKNLLQNCQRNYQSLSVSTRGTLMRRGMEKKKKTKPERKALLCSSREPRSKLNVQNHLYLHQNLKKKKSRAFTIGAVYSAPDWEEAGIESLQAGNLKAVYRVGLPNSTGTSLQPDRILALDNSKRYKKRLLLLCQENRTIYRKERKCFPSLFSKTHKLISHHRL